MGLQAFESGGDTLADPGFDPVNTTDYIRTCPARSRWGSPEIRPDFSPKRGALRVRFMRPDAATKWEAGGARSRFDLGATDRVALRGLPPIRPKGC